MHNGFRTWVVARESQRDVAFHWMLLHFSTVSCIFMIINITNSLPRRRQTSCLLVTTGWPCKLSKCMIVSGFEIRPERVDEITCITGHIESVSTYLAF
jgi:hypothetical protein